MGGELGGAKGVYLHSQYQPLKQAESWATEHLGTESRYAVVVSGFGLGYHVRALWEKLGGVDGDAVIVVAEPNVALLKAALGAVDLSEVLGSGRVLVFTELDRGRLVERLEPRSALLIGSDNEANPIGNVKLVAHDASVRANPGFHRQFVELIKEYVSYIRTGFVSLLWNNVATGRNIANNVGRYATTPPIDAMENAFVTAGVNGGPRPAVLVAAGPSLAKNMHLLKELLGEEQEVTEENHEGTEALRHKGTMVGGGRRAVIIAVQTMLKPLLAAGIEPDFVTSLDYNTVSTRFFENLEESGSTGRVHLVARATANWNVLDVFTGTMSVIHDEFAQNLLRDAFPPRKGLKAAATVAHLSFYLAEFLGCNPIIMIGQDLGFVDGLYYKPGTAIHETWGVELGRFNTLETKEWERIVRSRAILRKIPDIHGHPMYTEEQFFVYLQQFERDFAASRCKVIDATEGGAKKQGVEVMTLRAAIDAYCGVHSSDFGIQNEGAIGPAWKRWSCDVGGNLGRALGALKLRVNAAREMKETCDATIPLLKQMVESQADREKMNRLFVEVDGLREKVGRDPGTFEMVCFLNTIGEMRRFQADLGVRGAKKDSLERQRRQLLRDIEYVGNLRTGCERLLEILDEAVGRVERQMLAVREGRGWPREVAGARGGG